MHTVRSLHRGPNGTRGWLVRAGIGVFAVLGGAAALTLPYGGTGQAVPAGTLSQAITVSAESAPEATSPESIAYGRVSSEQEGSGTDAGPSVGSGSDAFHVAQPATIKRATQPTGVPRPASTRSPATKPGGVVTGVAWSWKGASGNKVVAEALRHQGAPYRFGASGPSSFDCSGFTMYVFRKFGVSLPHRARSQRSAGRAVSASAARPGDLVVFSEGGTWGHVAIYLGNGYIIAAPHSGAVVHVQKLWSSAVVFRRLTG